MPTLARSRENLMEIEDNPYSMNKEGNQFKTSVVDSMSGNLDLSQCVFNNS